MFKIIKKAINMVSMFFPVEGYFYAIFLALFELAFLHISKYVNA